MENTIKNEEETFSDAIRENEHIKNAEIISIIDILVQNGLTTYDDFNSLFLKNSCRKCRLDNESSEITSLLESLDIYTFGWIIGLIEGEGCFYCKTSKCKLKNGTVCYPLCGFTLMSTDLDVMTKFSDLLRLDLKGPYYKNKNRKKVWSVQITGNKALSLMKYIRNYLSERRKHQIDKSIEWQNKERFV